MAYEELAAQLRAKFQSRVTDKRLKMLLQRGDVLAIARRAAILQSKYPAPTKAQLHLQRIGVDGIDQQVPRIAVTQLLSVIASYSDPELMAATITMRPDIGIDRAPN